MTESKHTPLPFREYAPEVDAVTEDCYRSIEAGPGFMPDENLDGGFCLTGIISPANASYIVQACNAYPALVEALRAFMLDCCGDPAKQESLCDFCERGYAALRAAGEEL